jgi:GWxTD domain-containing protein
MKQLSAITVILLLLALPGCISTNRLTTINYRGAVAPFQDNNPFSHTLLHTDDSSSLLIFEVDMNKLKYIKNKGSGAFSARYSVAYQVYPDITSNTVADSSTVTYSDSLLFGTFHRKTHQVAVATPNSEVSFLHVIFSDRHAARSFNAFYEVRKSDSDPYNYLVKNESGTIHYHPYKRYYDRYRFAFRDDLSIPLAAEFYDISGAGIAPPPFAEESHNDSGIFHKEAGLLEQGILHTAGKEGLFIIKKKHQEKGGMRFLSKNTTYPAPGNVKGFTGPLRYITTNKEYLALKHAVDKTAATEQFWIDATGSYDRAFERMATYDQRVTNANRFFSSYKEGWKTDRGMIYIIFGWPDRLLKYEQQEKWIYSDGATGEPLTFIFRNKMFSYPVKDFFLERNEKYRIPWYEKVENWKN